VQDPTEDSRTVLDRLTDDPTLSQSVQDRIGDTILNHLLERGQILTPHRPGRLELTALVW
jgi:hypothetical protein